MEGLSSTCSVLSCILQKKLSSEFLSARKAFGNQELELELELSSAQAFLLALVHSLAKGDQSTSIFLIELSHQLRFPSHLRVWLEEDIRIHQENVVRLFANLAHLKAPDHLISVLLGLANKYKVTNRCKAQRDNSTLDFLSRFNVSAREDAMTQTDPPIKVHPVMNDVFKNNLTDAEEQEKTNIIKNYPQKPLNVAAISGNNDTLEKLIRSGANPEEKDGFYGNTGIHWAVRGDNVEALELYKQLGVDISLCDNIVWTPLHIAADSYCHKSLLWLLDNGADIEAKDCWQQTPIFRAAFKGHVAVARLLLDRGANIHVKDKLVHTPLYTAVKYGHTMLAKLLIEHGADVKICDDWGRGLLHRAVEKGSLPLMELLIENGCEVNSADNWGRTPLHDAVQASNAVAVTFFLSKGAVIEAKDRNGCTPLYEAGRAGDMNLARKLLENGADPNSIAKDGTTPVQVAKGKMIKRMLMAKRRL